MIMDDQEDEEQRDEEEKDGDTPSNEDTRT